VVLLLTGIKTSIMGIRVFISGNSGNKEMVTHQHRILMIMESMKFDYEVVDIAGPGMDEAKDFMRANSKKKEGTRHALPPQIFNEEKYCGNFEDFDIANEDDTLEEFLLLPKPVKEGELPKPAEGEPAPAPTENGDVTMSEDKAEVMKEEEAELEGAKEE